MSQSQFKYKNDYAGFLASKPSPQQVIDFIVYVDNLPSQTLEDIETILEACKQVKDESTYVRKLGYSYDSQFLIYEAMFWKSRSPVFQYSQESFKNAVDIGLQSLETLGNSNPEGIRMARRAELMLRYPEVYGYSEKFRDEAKANKVKQQRLQGPYFDQHECFQDFVKFDLNEAACYAEKGSWDYHYIQLYLHKDKEALEYFRKKWEQCNKSQDIVKGITYLHALQAFDPPAASAFEKQFEKLCQEKGDAEAFTKWALMGLRKHSHLFGLGWDAGLDEPSKEQIPKSLRHCDMGIAKLKTITNKGPYEYRNGVFYNMIKGWILAHLADKSFDNYIESLRFYKEALRYYVNVDDYHRQLQHALGKYIQITKEVLTLFASPHTLGFDNAFKERQETHKVYQEYVDMIAKGKKTFPYLEPLKAMFQMGNKMAAVKAVNNAVFEKKKEVLTTFIVDQLQKTHNHEAKRQVQTAITEHKTQAEHLQHILQDQQLNAYYEGFMRTFSDCYLVSVSVTQQMFQLQIQNKLPIKVITFLTSMIPMIGQQVTAAVGGVLEFVDNEKTKARASQIAKLAPNATRLDALSQSLAIKIILDQKEQIKHLEERLQKNGKEHIPFVDKILSKVKEAKNGIFNATELFDSCEAQMGNRHASLLLENMVATGTISKIRKATPAMKIAAFERYMKENQSQFRVDIDKKVSQAEKTGDTDKNPNQKIQKKKSMGCCGGEDSDCQIY